MSTQVLNPSVDRRPSRTEARRIGARLKAARRRRTRRLRRGVAALALAAFVGPFAAIYAQMSAGRDPGLAKTGSVAKVLAPDVAAGVSTASKAADDRAAAQEQEQEQEQEQAPAQTVAPAQTQAQTVAPAPVQTQQS